MRPIRPGQLALLQGGYFLLTGIWPLLSRRTFEAVTGAKQDFWLARTVGVLVASVGSVLVLTGKRDRVGPDARWLAASSAAGLAAIDILYAAARTNLEGLSRRCRDRGRTRLCLDRARDRRRLKGLRLNVSSRSNGSSSPGRARSPRPRNSSASTGSSSQTSSIIAAAARARGRTRQPSRSGRSRGSAATRVRPFAPRRQAA
jgi:hypothetical protein